MATASTPRRTMRVERDVCGIQGFHMIFDAFPENVERGEAVQVEPIKSNMKAPGAQRLKLKYDNPISSFAFNFNLRRYSVGCLRRQKYTTMGGVSKWVWGRGLHSSTFRLVVSTF